MCVCTYLGTYVQRTYVCIYVCMYICMYLCMYVCRYTLVCNYVYIIT